jgi:dipeptidyl aminopeptidase/acylaminoacyl peptidase
VKPTDLALFRAYGRPVVAPEGDVFAALSTPDLDADSYRSVLQRLRDGRPPEDFTHGPRDSAPVLSPDGETLVFLRAGESGPAQLYAMPRRGGEPRRLAEHPLGASAVTFSPDGRSIAYLAAVPEPGRYGTPAADNPEPGAANPAACAAKAGADAAKTGADAKTGGTKTAPEAEPPRRITTMSYRSDGKGFVLDKPEQVFLLSLDAEGDNSKPRQLTAEPGTIGRPAFTPDGRELLYVRRVAPDELRGEIAAVPIDATEPGLGRSVILVDGDATMPVAHGETLYYFGSAYSGNDFAGHTVGLWAVPLAGGTPRRMTDEATVHCEPSVGEPVVTGGRVLVPVADRGAVGVRSVPLDAADVPLPDLAVLLGGPRVVKAFSVTGTTLAAVLADPETTGDIVTVDIGDGVAPAAPETRLRDVSSDLRAAGLARQVEITATAPDGYPVHGWLVLPPGDGPHPVLLDVHGGPHAAYTWGVFDEAQMYATNGYAVVLPNPRGSSGYGRDHGRAIVGALGTVDADDVLALLDAALARADCDAGRVGVMGGSYGGFMTSWLSSHAADRFVAGISERAVNAWDSFTGASDIGFFFGDGYVGSDRDEQWAKSPLAHADRIGIPLLIVHSEQDWRCPLEQAQRLFVALKRRGHETEMLVFPGEGHELSRSGRPQHRRQRFEAILQWWNRYLPVG